VELFYAIMEQLQPGRTNDDLTQCMHGRPELVSITWVFQYPCSS